MKLRAYCLVGVILVFTIRLLIAEESFESADVESKSIEVILHAMKMEDKEGEYQLVVTFVNLGTEAIYIPMVISPSFELRDEQGNQMMNTIPILLDIRPLPSRKPMVPVWKLEPNTGRAVVLNDIMKGYDNLKNGRYSVHLPWKTLSSYNKENIIFRDDEQQRFWVRADVHGERVEVSHNIIYINFSHS